MKKRKTVDEILDELVEKLINSLEDDIKVMSKEFNYNCSYCRDTGITPVYGGPDRRCGCKEKYK